MLLVRSKSKAVLSFRLEDGENCSSTSVPCELGDFLASFSSASRHADSKGEYRSNALVVSVALGM